MNAKVLDIPDLVIVDHFGFIVHKWPRIYSASYTKLIWMSITVTTFYLHQDYLKILVFFLKLNILI